MNPEAIGRALEAASSEATAKAAKKQIHTLRGVRGTPQGDVARIAAEAWKKHRPKLPQDELALDELFGQAWEDGLVAIALLAALGPDRPEDVMETGLDWLDRIDETTVADALGWYVIGAGALACGADLPALARRLSTHPKVAGRRAGVMAGLAMTPTPIEGAAAGALRARLGEKHVAFVSEPLSEALAGWCDAFVRDEDPTVRKGLRRVVSAWAEADPDAAEAWMEAVRGGAPKLLREAITHEARKARRRAERALAAADEAGEE